MDLNTLRSATTVLMLLIFIGIVIWAYSRKRRGAFDAAFMAAVASMDSPASRTSARSAESSFKREKDRLKL